jgi:hypothetical protein
MCHTFTRCLSCFQDWLPIFHRGVSFVPFRFFLTGARRLQVAPGPGVRRLEPVGRHARHPVLPGRDLLLRRADGREGRRRGSLQGAPVPCHALQLQEGETKHNAAFNFFHQSPSKKSFLLPPALKISALFHAVLSFQISTSI